MRFSDFLRMTVLLSAGAATALAAVTLAAAATHGDSLVVPVVAGWWVIAGIIGIWLGVSAFMDYVATQNFQMVTRVLSSIDIRAVETAKKIGDTEAARRVPTARTALMVVEVRWYGGPPGSGRA